MKVGNLPDFDVNKYDFDPLSYENQYYIKLISFGED